METIMERQTIEGFTENYGVYGCALSPMLNIPDGNVTVFWDGVEYECVNDGIAFGNVAEMSGVDTGEPFVFVHNAEWVVIALTSTATSHEIGIIGEITHKIDEKYLPDRSTKVVNLSDVMDFGVTLFGYDGSQASEREITQEEWDAFVSVARDAEDYRISVLYDGYGVHLHLFNNNVNMYTTRFNNSVKENKVIIEAHCTEVTYDEETKLVTATYYCAQRTLS
jgi:hypothetical protein